MNVEEYKRSTGAKRFRRTKEELSLGLSDEQALQRRLATSGGNPHEVGGRTDAPETNPCLEIELGPSKGPAEHRKARVSRSDGDIVIRISADKGVDSGYFEFVPKAPIEVVLDNSWYSWFDTLFNTPYEGNAERLVRHILNKGIGEVLTHFHFPADLDEYERPVKTMESVR